MSSSSSRHLSPVRGTTVFLTASSERGHARLMTATAQPWKTRQEIPDAQIRDAADQYEKARRRLAETGPGGGVLLPLMNVTAVALELYLKCLSAELEFTAIDDPVGGYVVTTTPKWGHRLVELFEHIPDDIRTDLEVAFRAQSGGLELKASLSRCDGAFEASRYPFERDADPTSYPLFLLIQCSEFLAAFVSTLEPHDRILWR